MKLAKFCEVLNQLMDKEAFNRLAMRGRTRLLSSMAWSTQDSKSFKASVLIRWSFAASNLSWHTISDRFMRSWRSKGVWLEELSQMQFLINSQVKHTNTASKLTHTSLHSSKFQLRQKNTHIFHKKTLIELLQYFRIKTNKRKPCDRCSFRSTYKWTILSNFQLRQKNPHMDHFYDKKH